MAIGILTRMLIQDAVYWSNPSSDGRAGKQFDKQVQIRVRWQEQSEQITTAAGEEVMSIAKVFPDRAVDVGGFLFLGKLTDISGDPTNPQVIDDAHEIVKQSQLPTLVGDQFLFTAFL